MVSLRPCGTRTGCKSGSFVLDQVVSQTRTEDPPLHAHRINLLVIASAAHATPAAAAAAAAAEWAWSLKKKQLKLSQHSSITLKDK